VALVDGLQAKQVHRRAGFSSRALCLPSKGGGVVREHVDCALTTVNVVNQDVVLGDGASQLQVRVRDGVGGVVAADKVPLDIEGKRHTSEEGVDFVHASGDKNNSAHARAGGVRGANGAGVGVSTISRSRVGGREGCGPASGCHPGNGACAG
jgi:hypothetical protein